VIDPESVSSIQAGLAAMSENSAQRAMVELGLKNAQRFDWDHNATQVMGVYRRAAVLHSSKQVRAAALCPSAG
jgi:hypothetical protein